MYFKCYHIIKRKIVEQTYQGINMVHFIVERYFRKRENKSLYTTKHFFEPLSVRVFYEVRMYTMFAFLQWDRS